MREGRPAGPPGRQTVDLKVDGYVVFVKVDGYVVVLKVDGYVVVLKVHVRSTTARDPHAHA